MRIAAHTITIDKFRQVIVLTILAFGLRFFRLGYHSLWFDEILSVSDANHSFKQIHAAIVASPPLFHYWLRCFYLAFGKNDFWLRASSAFWGVLAIPFLYYAVDQWSNSRRAFWAALLLAVSPFHIVYSQEVRMYSLVVFEAIGALYFWTQALEHDQTKSWSFFAFFALLGLYTHNWFPFLIAGQGLWFIGEGLMKKRISFKGICAFTAIGLLYAPWFPWLLRQSHYDVFGFVKKPGWRDLTITAYVLDGIRAPSGHSWIGVGSDARTPILVVATGLMLWGALRPGKDRLQSLRIWIAGMLFPLTAAWIVSVFIKPVYGADRYTILTLPAFIVTAARAFDPGSGTAQRVLAGVGVIWVAFCLFPLFHYFTNYQKASWRAVAEWINPRAGERDSINFNGLAIEPEAFDWNHRFKDRLCLSYYLRPAIKAQENTPVVPDQGRLFIPVRMHPESTHLQSISDLPGCKPQAFFNEVTVFVCEKIPGVYGK